MKKYSKGLLIVFLTVVLMILGTVAAYGDEAPDYIKGYPLTEKEIAEQKSLEPELKALPEVDVSIDAPASLGRTRAGFPSKYDSRELGYITSVKDQNPFGACWAFAAASAAETSMIKDYHWKNSSDFSEAHLAYFFYNRQNDPLGNTKGDQNVADGDPLEVGGNHLLTAQAMAGWTGAAEESVVPYPVGGALLGTVSPSKAYENTAVLKNAYFLSGTKEEIKSSIQRYGSVTASYYHDDYFYNPDTAAYFCDEKNQINHSITIVGWDDSYRVENFNTGHTPKKPGAWIVKNSWSDGWGDDGYFYLSYEDETLNTAVAYEFQPEDTYDHNYYYDGNAIPSEISVPQKSKISNIYEVKGNRAGYDEMLAAVEFTLRSVDTNYSVQVYTELKDKKNPQSGTAALVKPVRGTTSYEGIYTVPLDQKVRLTRGSYYSIVVTLEGSNGETPSIGVEQSYDYGWLQEKATITPGQSFGNTGEGWDDLANYGNNKWCARIKGFTTDFRLTGIKLNKTSMTLKRGASAQLAATTVPLNYPEKSLSWKSSNTKVAAVSAAGKVTAKGGGRADITAAAKTGGISAVCRVTVPYTLTYKLSGGKNNKANPATYYGKKITLKSPSRAGYTFSGWYKDSRYKSRISSFSSGDRTLYAKWKKVTVSKGAIKKLKKTSKTKMKVYYKKISGAKGYRIAYSTSRKFTKKTTKYVTAKSTTKTLTKLKKNKRYYVKVRAYKLDSTGKKVYGKYSTAKSKR